MSAFSIGTAAYRDDRAKADLAEIAQSVPTFSVSAIEEAELPPPDDAFAEIIKWVPGEVIAGYAAVIAAVTAGDNQAGDALAWVFVGLAGLWILLAGTAEWFKLGPGVSFRWGQMIARVLLGAFGFLLWSFVVPGSPSRSWAIVGGIGEPALSVAMVLAASLFGMVAWLVVGLMDRYRPTW